LRKVEQAEGELGKALSFTNRDVRYFLAATFIIV